MTSQHEMRFPFTNTEFDESDYLDGEYEDFEEPHCPECGEDGSTTHHTPLGYSVCSCSPLYPDLRPGDLPWNLSFAECSCERKYSVTGYVICKCNSPDLYALMERLHELELTENFELVLPDQSVELHF